MIWNTCDPAVIAALLSKIGGTVTPRTNPGRRGSVLDRKPRKRGGIIRQQPYNQYCRRQQQ